MSENEKTVQTAQNEQPKTAPGNMPVMSPTEAAEKVSKGRFKLPVPIEDGVALLSPFVGYWLRVE